MRTKNSFINSIAGLIYRLIVLSSTFIVRSFFVKYFNADFVGLEGLYANIIGIFSLIDLGFGNAIAFSLYKPIHNNDTELLSSIMRLYRKVYVILGIIIEILSIVCLPFLKWMIKGYTIPLDTIKQTFLIYSLGVAITYFFSYNRTLVFAYQKNYIILLVDTIVKLSVSLLQLYVIISINRYGLYLFIVVIGNLISNILVSLYVKKNKFYKKKDINKLDQSYIHNLLIQVKALAVTNICGKGITSTDNIIISSILGVVELAKNSNYSIVIQAIQGLINSVLDGARASIGDLISEGKPEKIFQNFNRYNLIYGYAASVCFLGFFFSSKYLISIWVGDSYLFESSTNFVLSLNLLLILIMQPISVFQNLGGLYVVYQPVSIGAVIINLIISIALAFPLGILGVFIGTTLSYIFQIIGFTRLLYKLLFIQPVQKYWKSLLKIFISVLISFFLISQLNLIIRFEGVLGFILSTICSVIIYSIVFTIMYRRTSDFVFYKTIIMKSLRRL